MNNLVKLMLLSRWVTSRLPKIRGLGLLLALIARYFRKKKFM